MSQHFRLVNCEKGVLWENRALGSLLLCSHFHHGCVHRHYPRCSYPAREITQQHLGILWWWKGGCADWWCLPGFDQVSIKKDQSTRSDVGIQSKLTNPLLFPLCRNMFPSNLVAACFRQVRSAGIWVSCFVFFIMALVNNDDFFSSFIQYKTVYSKNKSLGLVNLTQTPEFSKTDNCGQLFLFNISFLLTCLVMVQLGTPQITRCRCQVP